MFLVDRSRPGSGSLASGRNFSRGMWVIYWNCLSWVTWRGLIRRGWSRELGGGEIVDFRLGGDGGEGGGRMMEMWDGLQCEGKLAIFFSLCLSICLSSGRCSGLLSARLQIPKGCRWRKLANTVCLFATRDQIRVFVFKLLARNVHSHPRQKARRKRETRWSKIDAWNDQSMNFEGKNGKCRISTPSKERVNISC